MRIKAVICEKDKTLQVVWHSSYYDNMTLTMTAIPPVWILRKLNLTIKPLHYLYLIASIFCGMNESGIPRLFNVKVKFLVPTILKHPSYSKRIDWGIWIWYFRRKKKVITYIWNTGCSKCNIWKMLVVNFFLENFVSFFFLGTYFYYAIFLFVYARTDALFLMLYSDILYVCIVSISIKYNV